MIKVSIIIVNFNGLQHTTRCIESIQRTHEEGYFEVIVVDNDSRDGSVESIKEQYPNVKVIAQQQNLGFGKANNIGVNTSTGKYLFFANNDTLFKRNILKPLSEFMETNESIGIAAPMLLNPDGSYQLSYGKFPSLMNELLTKRDTRLFKNIPEDRSPRQVDWVSFAAVMIRRTAFEKVNGFDERYFLYFEDADFCFRLQNAGYQSFYCAEYSLIHIGGGSWSNTITNIIKTEYRRSQLLFYALHNSRFELFALRCYILLKFLYPFLCNRGEEHYQALSVIRMALSSYAHRS